MILENGDLVIYINVGPHGLQKPWSRLDNQELHDSRDNQTSAPLRDRAAWRQYKRRWKFFRPKIS